MTVKVDRAKFAEALARAATCTSKNLSIADRIQLFADGETLVVAATDLVVGMNLTVPADGALESMLVSPAVARQVGALSSPEVKLSTSKGRLVVAGSGTYRIPYSSGQDFPALPDFDSVGEWKPDLEFWDRLQSAATQSDYSRKTNRPELASVRIHETLDATDSYRGVMVPVGAPCDLLVPHAAVARIAKLPEPSSISWGARHAGFHGDWGVLWASLIDAKYPDLSKLYPSATPTSMTLDSEHIIEVVSRASLASGPATPIRMRLGDGSVEVFVESEAGGFSEVVKAKTEGDLTVAFNPGFLISSLSPVGGTVEIRFSSETGPAVISNGDWWSSILMPVKV